MTRAALLASLVLLLAGCAGGPRHPHQRDPGLAFHPPIEILQKYDADHDGILTRAELEAGLKAEFDADDTDHDGRLDKDEARAVNNRRWAEGLSTTSTIVDWNQDGYVDFNEFAGTARSYFTQLDRDNEGKIDLKKLAPRPAKSGEDDDGPSGAPKSGGN
jgi:Ca2+-binding EF-hand superfamily protein